MTKEEEMVAYIKEELSICESAIRRGETIDGEYMKHRLENFLTFFAPRPMSFMDAVAAMEQGKRVKRKIWDNENYYIYFNPTSAPDKNCLCGADGDLAGLDATDFRATDWEEYKEGE